MNQPLQTAALANLIVASRLPAEGNFRRDAILGAMVGQVNPLAGALVAIRSADSLTALIRERDALRAQQPAPAAPAPPAGGGRPVTLDEEGRKALQAWLRDLIAAATRMLESLNAPPVAAGGPAAPAGETSEETARKFAEAAAAVAAALSSIAAQAEKAVVNQDENQAMMRQMLERTASSGSGTPAPSSTAKGKPD